MKKISITVEPTGAPEGSPVKGMAAPAAEADESVMQTAAPTGNYSPKGLNALVKASNSLLPLFGQNPNYPMFNGPLKQLPTDFVRVLSMFKSAIDDAISEDELAAEMAFEFEGLTDDNALQLLAGKLSKLALDKAFKKWLASPPSNETEGSEYGEEAGMPEDENMPQGGNEAIDNMFMSRM